MNVENFGRNECENGWGKWCWVNWHWHQSQGIKGRRIKGWHNLCILIEIEMHLGMCHSFFGDQSNPIKFQFYLTCFSTQFSLPTFHPPPPIHSIVQFTLQSRSLQKVQIQSLSRRSIYAILVHHPNHLFHFWHVPNFIILHFFFPFGHFPHFCPLCNVGQFFEILFIEFVCPWRILASGRRHGFIEGEGGCQKWKKGNGNVCRLSKN
jgi:hypothetical protein